MTAVSGQLRSLLESLNSRHSLLGEVINSDPATRQQRLTLADIRKGFADITHLATDLDRTVRKINNDESLFGATLFERTRPKVTRESR